MRPLHAWQAEACENAKTHGELVRVPVCRPAAWCQARRSRVLRGAPRRRSSPDPSDDERRRRRLWKRRETARERSGVRDMFPLYL